MLMFFPAYVLHGTKTQLLATMVLVIILVTGVTDTTELPVMVRRPTRMLTSNILFRNFHIAMMIAFALCLLSAFLHRHIIKELQTMTVGLFSGPAQMLALYSALVALSYMESDGFRQQASFLGSFPYLMLAFCTLNLTMPEKKRYLTATWLFLSAVSFYIMSTKRSILPLASMIMSLGKIVYLLTFLDCVKRTWNEVAILLLVYYASLIYYCFADLYYSIPFFVTLMALQMALDCFIVGAAGAVYKFGSKKRTYSSQAGLIRLLGTMLSLMCSSVIMLNRFGNRIHGFAYYTILLEYTAHPLMFLANEMAF